MPFPSVYVSMQSIKENINIKSKRCGTIANYTERVKYIYMVQIAFFKLPTKVNLWKIINMQFTFLGVKTNKMLHNVRQLLVKRDVIFLPVSIMD